MTGLFILLAIAAGLLIIVLTAMLAWEMTHPPRHTAAYAIARGMACSPDDLGLEFESWTLDRPDGARLPVWDISNPQSAMGNPKSMTAVFIHGWGHSGIDMLARIRPFDRACRRIIMYDLRGHGDSERCISRLGDGEDRDLIALLDRIGDEHIVLVGHSMGAVIAMQAAASAPADARSRIVGIIAYGPYLDFHTSLRGRLRTHGYPARPVTDLALILLRSLGIHPCDSSIEAIATLPCPIRVIHGGDDLISPIDHSHRIVEAAKHARLHVVEGGGHTDVHSVDALRHDEIVLGFLDFLRSD
jgi:pimeloyl-ACP methyl ester carboxylesterase